MGISTAFAVAVTAKARGARRTDTDHNSRSAAIDISSRVSSLSRYDWVVASLRARFVLPYRAAFAFAQNKSSNPHKNQALECRMMFVRVWQGNSKRGPEDITLIISLDN